MDMLLLIVVLLLLFGGGGYGLRSLLVKQSRCPSIHS